MIGDTTYIARDSFARMELHRATIHPDDRHQTCRWCGSPRARFQYAWVPDDAPHRARWSPPFCSIGCYRTHHQRLP